MITARFEPGPLHDPWLEAIDRLEADQVVPRLWDGDHTAIQDDPVECADRLGWIRAPWDADREWPRWSLLADETVEGAADRSGNTFDHVLVLGMGGSSLFPEVLARTFEPGEGFPSIRVLDSTDPGAVRRATEELDRERTLVVAASKSGSTIETRSHLAHFWSRHPLGPNFVAITDPGSALEAWATEQGFRAVVHGNPEIGGRFSALSAFGMFPAALMGLDGVHLLDTAVEAAEALGPDTPAEHHLGCQLGAFLAVAARAGRDRATFLIDERLEAFGSWVEQLVAESTGKHGVGILPVLGEPADSPDMAGRVYVVIGEHPAARLELPGPSVRLTVEEPSDLGAQVYLWEWATTIAGVVLGINPFDQPDVESAKLAARAALADTAAATTFVSDAGAGETRSSDGDGGSVTEERPLDEALALLRDGDALVICAFVDPSMEPQLQRSRLALGRHAGVATTLGIGPRFLHSTGQLHKGGADRHVVIQVVDSAGAGDEARSDVEVPGESFTFGALVRAQADGDLVALREAGKRAVRVALAELLAAAD